MIQTTGINGIRDVLRFLPALMGPQQSAQQNYHNSGLILDEDMSLEHHVAATCICKSCFFHLRNICKIRKRISIKACEKLIHAFISSKLDICNSLLYGVSKSSVQKLQLVQNAAARVLTFSHKSKHITPILHSLQNLDTH